MRYVIINAQNYSNPSFVGVDDASGGRLTGYQLLGGVDAHKPDMIHSPLQLQQFLTQNLRLLSPSQTRHNS